jgi:plasmid stability protein
MGTITIRRLDDAVIEGIKRRAAEAGRSMEEEARQALQQTYGGAERARLRQEAVAYIRDLHARGLLPKGKGVDSVDIIREMREERDEQLAAAIEGRDAADRRR